MYVYRYIATEHKLYLLFRPGLAFHGEVGIAHTQSPLGHDLGDVDSRDLRPSRPKIVRLCVGICMLAHVLLQTLTELVLAHNGSHHVHHNRALAVGDRVEYLLHLLCVLDGHDHGVGGAQRVQSLRSTERIGGELLPATRRRSLRSAIDRPTTA